MKDDRLFSHNMEKQKEYIREELATVGVTKDYRLSINSSVGIVIKLNSLKVDVNLVNQVIKKLTSAGRLANVEYTDAVLEDFAARYGYIAKHLYTNTKNRTTAGVVAKNALYFIMFEPSIDGHPFYTLESSNGGGRISQLPLNKVTQFTEANLAAWICKQVLYKGHYKLVQGLEFGKAPTATDNKKMPNTNSKQTMPQPRYATDKKANAELWDNVEATMETALRSIVVLLNKQQDFDVDTDMTKEAVRHIVDVFKEYGVDIPYVDADM